MVIKHYVLNLTVNRCENRLKQAKFKNMWPPIKQMIFFLQLPHDESKTYNDLDTGLESIFEPIIVAPRIFGRFQSLRGTAIS